jgi:hypothetical protein
MDEIAVMKARQEISEGKARYCRLLDTKDWAGFADLFTDDFVLDLTEGTKVPVTNGRDAALKQIRRRSCAGLIKPPAAAPLPPQICGNASSSSGRWPREA